MKTVTRALAVVVAGIAATTLAACSAGGGTNTDTGSGGTSTLVFAGFGGATGDAIDQAWFQPYAEETGVTVTTDPTNDQSKLKQMVDAGAVTWDLVEAGSDNDLVGGTVYEDIDCDVVACDDFTGGFTAYPQGVPWFIYSQILAYNTDLVKDAPENWEAFFDASIPGQRALNGDEGFRGILEAALLADGVAADDLYPLDIERALEKLDPIKDRLIYFSSGQQCIDLVTSGEAAMGNCYNEATELAKQNGDPIDYTWGQQVQSADYLAIAKGSKNVEAAQEAIAYLVGAEHNGDLSSLIPYGPPNPKATVDPAVEESVPTSNEGEGINAPILPNQDFWRDSREDVFETVANWKAS